MSGKDTSESMILPGSTIGILGGGQLGRMMVLAGRTLGYRFITLDPTQDSPCGQVSDEQIVAPYTDINAALDLARKCDLITYEFENVDAGVASTLQSASYVPQGSELLRVTQHRVVEKRSLQNAGVPTANFVLVRTADELAAGIHALGFPCVLKTTRGGYDGKGQWLIRSASDAEAAHRDCRPLLSDSGLSRIDDKNSQEQDFKTPLILESFVSFEKEISVIIARSPRGEVRTFPVSENVHVNHILHQSIVPARISTATEESAVRIAMQIAEELDMVGLLAVEMFVTDAGELFVNELAPRPHNSGHYTMDACLTSQFEQQIRAVCNLPLGSTRLLSPVVMVNILGEHVAPLMEQLHHLPDHIKVHLYGKHEAKRGRKMGHLNVVSDTTEEALIDIEKLGIWGN